MKSSLRSLRTGAAMCAQGKGRDEGPWRWRWRCSDDDDDDFLMIIGEIVNFMLPGWWWLTKCWTMIVIGGTKLLKLTGKSSCDENCDDPRKRRAKTWAVHLLVSWNQAQFVDQLMALFSADPGPWTQTLAPHLFFASSFFTHSYFARLSYSKFLFALPVNFLSWQLFVCSKYLSVCRKLLLGF